MPLNSANKLLYEPRRLTAAKIFFATLILLCFYTTTNATPNLPTYAGSNEADGDIVDGDFSCA